MNKIFELVLALDKKSHLRIIESFIEMFKEPRINGWVFLVLLPTITCLSSPNFNLRGILIIFILLNLFTLFMVRISLD